MADDYGLLDNDEQMATCSQCEAELEWVVCEQCGGEGEYDCYDDDPMWFEPDDTEPCALCGGAGGWYWCGVCKSID
jgi:predicted amidophosphoribosyltransferase